MKKTLKELEISGKNKFGKSEAVFEAKEYKGATRDFIVLYHKDGKSKDIGFRNFQRYVSDFKNSLNKKSQ